MIQLPNGCKCSELNVSPSNWQSSKASLKKKWYVYYRFYDPKAKDKYPKGKLRIIKGMNEANSLEERREIVQALITLEINELKTLGFNPILEKHLAPTSELTEIHLILFLFKRSSLPFKKQIIPVEPIAILKVY